MRQIRIPVPHPLIIAIIIAVALFLLWRSCQPV